ncbi:MAG: PASTA domain-containing protein, partial [Bacillota bacterium]|nr:PASTA domain-containing protein [Bacillota bacterium]
VMFELLTGRLPFSGESAVSIALKHLQSETPSVRRWNPDIPQSVENIVLKATAKDPFHRYNSVDAMEEDLQTAMYPIRANEAKFTIPLDDEATKAIPVITTERPFQNLDETMVHGNDKLTKNSSDPNVKTAVKKKRKKWPIVMISLFLVLLILSVMTVTVFPNWFSPKEIEVPQVSGMGVDEAEAALTSKGFLIGNTNQITDNDVPNGKVVKTEPPAGDTAKEGSKIDLYQSTGKEQIEFSDYKGRQFDDLKALPDFNRFKDVSKTEVYDDSEPGTILSQDPVPGTMLVPEESAIVFEVSKGPKKIILKDLSAYNSQTLKDYADSTGLIIDMSQKEYDDNVPADMVISQSPHSGTEMKKGDTVKVILSKGKEEIPPKQVIEEVTIPYDPVSPGKPQEVQIYIEDMDNSMTEPIETFSMTKTEKRQLKLMVQSGKTAGYRIIRDNEVIIDKVVPYPEDSNKVDSQN